MSNAHTDHKQFEYLLPDLAAGVLDGSDRELINGHLEQCQQCRERLQEFRQIMVTLRATNETDQVPEGYFANIVPRFHARASKHSDAFLGMRWLQLVPPAAAFIIVAGLLSTLQPSAELGNANGLKSLAGELEAADLTDAYLSEVDQQVMSAMSVNDALAGALSREAVSRELLERIADAQDLPVLQSFDDLENEELDILLQRLQSRKYL